MINRILGFFVFPVYQLMMTGAVRCPEFWVLLIALFSAGYMVGKI
jgi:hypothetical protein